MIEDTGERYNSLLAERKDLEKKLSQFDFHRYRAITSKDCVDEEIFQKIVEEWQQEVNKKTHFLTGLQEFGVGLFHDHLQYQPGFPDEEIFFDSPVVSNHNIRNLTTTSGLTRQNESRIDIADSQPTARQQVEYLLGAGRLHPTVITLIHELTHLRHYRQSPETPMVLSEAQAYFSGRYADNFSLVDIAKKLATWKKSDGSYRFEHDQIMKSLEAVADLYALGQQDEQIASRIAESHFDEESGDFIPLHNTVKELQQKKGVRTRDLGAERDIFLLRSANERKRAQLLLYQTIDQHITQDELTAYETEYAAKTIDTPPAFTWQGMAVDPVANKQRCLYPVDEKFPYEPNGKRAGIVFGLFPGKNKQPPEFGIGRITERSKAASVERAITPADKEEYFTLLADCANQLSAESKEELFNFYLEAFPLSPGDPPTQLLEILVSPEEMKKFFEHKCEKWHLALGAIKQELNALVVTLPHRDYQKTDEIKLEEYSHFVSNIHKELAVFGLTIEEVTDDASRIQLLADVATELQTLKKMLDHYLPAAA